MARNQNSGNRPLPYGIWKVQPVYDQEVTGLRGKLIRLFLLTEWAFQWTNYYLDNRTFVEFLGHAARFTLLVSVSSAAISFIFEEEVPRQARHAQAWSIITVAAGESGNLGRDSALKMLASDGVNLSGLNLNGVDLQNIDLPNANLSGSKMKNAKLYQANLSSTILSKLDFTDAGLRGANLTRSDLSQAVLKAKDLRNVNFAASNLYKACLAGTNLSAANFTDANLTNAVLSNARLKGANFTGANISRTQFAGSKIVQAQIDSACYVENDGPPKLPDGLSHRNMKYC